MKGARRLRAQVQHREKQKKNIRGFFPSFADGLNLHKILGERTQMRDSP